MSKKLFTGAGGSKGPTTTDDNLISEDIVEFALAVSEGPIRGLAEGAKSFMVGETPLLNQNNQKNFEKFAIGVHPGYPEGSAAPLALKLGGVSSNQQVGVQLVQNVPVVRQALGALRGTIDQLEVRILINRLVEIDDEDGSTYYNNAEFRLEYKLSRSATWLPFVTPEAPKPIDFEFLWLRGQLPGSGVTSRGDGYVSLRGKTSGGYVKEFRIDVPRVSDDDWEIRVIKLSEDDSETNVVDLVWESFQCTNKTQLTYPNTAIVHGLGVANGQFASIPEFSGIYDGLIVRVPSNYNPDLHTYDDSSPWDGSFKFAWTENPAWILYDLITNTRYGLAKHRRYLDANRFTFYEAGRWCDTMIPIAGTDKFRPRYTFNDVIIEPRPGMEMLQYVAGSFNGLVWDDQQGQIHLRVDKDDPAVQMFTPENVTEEGFSYTFTDITTRANDISVSFTNPELDWVEDRRRVANVTTNEENIAKFGRIPLDFIAVGCTNVHEAIAKAQVRLVSSLTETTMVAFNTTRQGALLNLYDVILVADPMMGWSATGRFTHYDSTHVYFRDPIYMEIVENFTMKIQTQLGIIEATVRPEEVGHVTRLELVGSQLPDNLPRYAVFSLEQTGGLGFGKPFRVMGLEEVDGSPYLYKVSAVEINRNKYLQSETGTVLDEPQYNFNQPKLPGKPTNFTATSGDAHIYIAPSGEVITRILTSWRKPPGVIVKEYELQYRLLRDEAWQSIKTTMNELYISPVVPGERYALRVCSTDPAGNKSEWASIADHTAMGKTTKPVALLSLTVKGGMFQNVISWSLSNAKDLKKTEIIAAPSDNRATANHLFEIASPSTSFTHAELGVGQELWYWGRVQDTSGNYSDYIGPVYARTEINPAKFLDILHDSITEEQLYVDLRNRIELVDGPPDLIGSVANQVLLEAQERERAVQLETDNRIAAIEQEIDDRIAAIQGEAEAREAYVISYTYSKSDSDLSLSMQGTAITAAYRSYTDDAIARVTSDSSADVRNYAYSKAESDSAESAQTSIITTAYKSYVDNAANTVKTDAAADVRSYAYSRTDSDSALASQSNTLTTAYRSYADNVANTARSDAAADVRSYAYSKSTVDDSITSASTTLTTNYRAYADGVANTARSDAAADVRSYAYSKSNTDSAIAASGSTLTTNYQNYANGQRDVAINTASTDVRSYAYSKSSTDGAINTMADTLRSEFTSQEGGATEAYVQNYTYTKAAVDQAFASQYSSLTTNYQNYTNSTVSTYAYSKSETDSAISSSTTTLSNTVGNHTNTLQTHQSVLDGVSAQYTVKVDNNGYVSGFGLASTPINGVPTSSFIVNVDKFAIVTPGQSSKVPFVVGQVNGVTSIGLAGVAVLDDAIVARHIDVVSLSAISAIIGDLQTATSGARTRIRDNRIHLYDAANNLIMEIGEFS